MQKKVLDLLFTINKKQMKKVLLIILIASVSSCATIFEGGHATPCQKQQKHKQVKREYRAGIIILDCCFGIVPLIWDFSTGAVYVKQTDNCK